MANYGIPFKHEAFHKAYAKQRNRELERDLVLAQTKLRYMMEHVGTYIVPKPPIASFLSAKDKLESISINAFCKELRANFKETSHDQRAENQQQR